MRLINAEALKKAILSRLDDDEARILEIVEEEIDNAPTVEFPNYGGQVVPDTLQGWRYEERPHGKWIVYKNIENTIYCSNCDMDFENNMTTENLFNYCPFCGSDNRESNSSGCR